MTIKEKLIKNSLLISIFLVVSATVLLFISGICLYESNDDLAMIRILSGQQGLTGSPDAIFISIPLGFALYKLYHLSGNTPWYAITMYGSLALAGVIGIRTALNSQLDVLSKAVSILAIMIFYVFMVCRLNFTAVSLFLWFSVISHISSQNIERKSFSKSEYIFGLFLGLSYLIRPDIITIALLFTLPMAASFFISRSIKRVFATLLPLGIIFLIAIASAAIFKNTDAYKEFKEFNSIRSSFTDTNKSAFNTKTPQALVKTGWDLDDYYLAQRWWFHDSNIFNNESFTTFLNNNAETSRSIISRSHFMYIFKSYQNNIFVLLLCFAVLIINRSKQIDVGKTQKTLLILSIISVISAWLVLSAIRFPPRIAIPLFAYLVILTAIFRPLFRLPQIKYSYFTTVISVLCCTGILHNAYSTYSQLAKETSFSKLLRPYSAVSINMLQKIYGSNTIFLNVNDSNYIMLAESPNPLLEYKDALKYVSFPSGWLINSPHYKSFLFNNNFKDRENVVPLMVNNPRVILRFWQIPEDPYEEYAKRLQSHMQAHYGKRSPGTKIVINKILDRRIMADGGGWVFFRIQTSPIEKS
jgi:hypothetical protein